MAGKNKGNTIKVKVTTVPTQGKAKTTTVEVAATGSSVKDVLAAAGLDAANRDITVNGAPAGLDTHVTAKDKVGAEERASVQVAERPQGS